MSAAPGENTAQHSRGAQRRVGQNAAVIERTVAVLAGGLSHEREVSLRSGRRLAAALREAGLAVREWDMDASLVERLRTDPPDAVAIALHGGEGENGSVQAVLELLGVPFVGTSAPLQPARGSAAPEQSGGVRARGLRAPAERRTCRAAERAHDVELGLEHAGQPAHALDDPLRRRVAVGQP